MKKIFTILGLTALSLASKAQTITGGNMDTWVSYSSFFTPLTRPVGWNTSDSLISLLKFASGEAYTGRVTESKTIKHGGTSSTKLVTGTDSFPTFITNAKIIVDLVTEEASYTGGTPVTKRISSVDAWVNYTSTSDSGMMFVEAYKNGFASDGGDSLIGAGFSIIKKNTAFTRINAEIDYNDASTVPDRIIVGLFTSFITEAAAAGTTMYIDDVTMFDATGIETPLINDQNITVAPNPAVNQLNINTNVNDDLSVTLYNTNGQAVLTQQFTKNAEINVSALSAGNYIYVISGQKSNHKYYSSVFTKQ